MVLAWVLFPLVMLAVCTGCGLLVEWLGGWRLSGALLPSAGLALVIVVAVVETRSRVLAPATTWVVLGLAVIGTAISATRLRDLRPDWWAIGLGLVVFGIFAAPIVASGQATVAGYGIDGDPAAHLLLARDVLAFGYHPINQFATPGATSIELPTVYLLSDYPVGADLAAGVLRPLVGQNLAWVYDPFIAVTLAFGALAIDELLRDLVRSRPLRALCAFVAGQAGLTFGFYLISSIKELCTTWVISVTVALVVATLRRPPSARALIPLLFICVAGLGVLAIPILPWLAIPVAAFIIASLWRIRSQLAHPSVRQVGQLVVVVVVALAAAWPVLKTAVASYNVTTATLTAKVDLGFLPGPLNVWQIMGIWPNGDFRFALNRDVGLVHVLLWISVVSAVLGAIWTLYRRAWGPLLLLVGNGIAAWVLIVRGSPYADAKVMAILSITAVLAAMLGAAALHDRISRILGWTLGGVLAIAVLWTNGLSLQTAHLAPRPRFAALDQIDQRFAGEMSRHLTFYNLWDFEWPAAFLPRVHAYVPHILPDPPAPPGTPSRDLHPALLQAGWDPNDITVHWLNYFKLLVLARSPTAAPPPPDFTLVDQDRYYDVYRRNQDRVLKRLRATSGLHKLKPLSCSRIRATAALATRKHARLTYSPQITAATLAPDHTLHPIGWVPFPTGQSPVPGALELPTEAGTVTGKIMVPRTGTYTVWLQGQLSQPVSVNVGLRHIGTVSGQIGPAGLFADVGHVHLKAGSQPVILNRSGESSFSPVTVGDALGDLVLTHGTSGRPAPVHSIAPARASTLCHRRLHWIDVVSGPRSS